MLIGVLLALSLASLYGIRLIIPRGAVAVVEVDGRSVCRLDLSVDTHRTIRGPLGETIIQIRAGRIRIADSCCPHRICVRTGWVEQAGRMIVCVPNRVMVRIEGQGDVDADAVSW